MAIERELKLLVAPRAAGRIARELALPARGRVLHSIYFYTRLRSLRRKRLALRLRRDGSRWRQTLKGPRADGMRNEWEAPLKSARFDLARLPHDLARLDLQPLFETRFVRRARLVEKGDAAIEIALDRGFVRAGRRRERISELELELKSGTTRALRRYARTLAARFALQPGAESKAERGYRLASGS